MNNTATPEATQYAAYWAEAKRRATEAGHRYVICVTVNKTHAAFGTVTGNGVIHPRPICAAGSPSARMYAGTVEDQTQEITCKRCLAALPKRLSELEKAAR